MEGNIKGREKKRNRGKQRDERKKRGKIKAGKEGCEKKIT